MGKGAQSSLEFVVLVGAMFFFFLTLLFVFQQDVSRKSYEKRDFAVNELALDVQTELSIAMAASDGYQREFEIKDDILGMNFSVSLISNSVYIVTEDGRHALSLPVQNVTGQIRKGDNFIRKVDGEVLLN